MHMFNNYLNVLILKRKQQILISTLTSNRLYLIFNYSYFNFDSTSSGLFELRYHSVCRPYTILGIFCMFRIIIVKNTCWNLSFRYCSPYPQLVFPAAWATLLPFAGRLWIFYWSPHDAPCFQESLPSHQGERHLCLISRSWPSEIPISASSARFSVVSWLWKDKSFLPTVDNSWVSNLEK